jgi:hypothetical protein
VRRTAVLTSIAALASCGSASAAVAGSNHLDIPNVHRIALVAQHGMPSHVVQRGTVSGKVASHVVHDVNRMSPYPKHVAFACKVNRGYQHSAIIRSNHHTWRVDVGQCGSVPFISTDGGQARAYHSTKKFRADFNYAFGVLRPRAEDVPSSVDAARLAHRDSTTSPWADRHHVTGKTARDLVKSFNHLKVEPPNTAHCQIVGGPEDRVVFATSKHRWVVTEASCTDVQVHRDGKVLPTLLPSKAWTAAVDAGFGR